MPERWWEPLCALLGVEGEGVISPRAESYSCFPTWAGLWWAGGGVRGLDRVFGGSGHSQQSGASQQPAPHSRGHGKRSGPPQLSAEEGEGCRVTRLPVRSEKGWERIGCGRNTQIWPLETRHRGHVDSG